MHSEFLVSQLVEYLLAKKTLRDLAETMASWDYEKLPLNSRNAVGELMVVSTEVLEGMRDESEFRQLALDIIERVKWGRRP